MAEDLWKLRQKRGLSVQQVAVRSGLPLLSIQAYEEGQPVRAADLPRLAKALFVDEFDIKLKSEPFRPRPGPPRAPAGNTLKPVAKSIMLARPSQIQHLLQLAAVIHEDEAALTSALGKPLNQLTLLEMRKQLQLYTEKVKQNKLSEAENRPPHTRRKRAHLPEGLDEFEMSYLQQHYEAQEELGFTLLNGQSFTGRIAGFTPYFITIVQADGQEITIQKLALAYYRAMGHEEAG